MMTSSSLVQIMLQVRHSVVIAVVTVAFAAWITARARSRDSACGSAASDLRALQQRWADEPLATAELLRPAYAAVLRQASYADVVRHLSPSEQMARCCSSTVACETLRPDSDGLIRFLDRVRRSIGEPRREALRRAMAGSEPRVVVVGAGPAGLPAAIVAHRAGGAVTVVDKRVARTREVWFDLAPGNMAAAGEEAAEERGDGMTGNAQRLLRAWGFFELSPRLEVDEGGSGVVSVRCVTLERFLLLLAQARVRSRHHPTAPHRIASHHIASSSRTALYRIAPYRTL
jgi:hypothetical protein